MTLPVIDIIAEGQFDDDLGDISEAPQNFATPTALRRAPDFDPREGQTFIDDPLLQWSEREEEEEEIIEEDEEDLEDWDSRLTSVNDEDWEIAERGELHFSSSRFCEFSQRI